MEEKFALIVHGTSVAFANVKNAAVTLVNVVKSFGSHDGVVRAVDGVSLEIARGEFFSLLGPSGCGKTTLLRLIGGFEAPDSGEIFVEGRSMAGIPPQVRPVNTVFQNYALFPHLNVFDNVAFGPRMKRTGGSELEKRVSEVMELTHIAELRDRMPEQISGGQRQRVALARALVNKPAVLLLDEPLAAIDAKLRGQLQADLRTLQRQLQTTFIHVTHDQEEALSLSDRVAVLNRGRVVQAGTAQEIYERPRTKFVAEFLGGCNVFSGKFVSDGVMETALGKLRVIGNTSENKYWGIRREDVRFGGTGENSVQGEIVEAAYTGSQIEYQVRAGTEMVRVLTPSQAAHLQRGARVHVQFSPEAILMLEGSDG